MSHVRQNTHINVSLLCFMRMHPKLQTKTGMCWSIYITNDDINCIGFQSCVNASIEASDDAILWGSRSFTNGVVEADGKVSCAAESSCAKAESLTLTSSSDGNIFCNAALSCGNAESTSTQKSSGTLYCMVTTHAGASVTDTLSIVGWGTFSLNNGYINPGTAATFSIELYGWMAGYNLTIDCQSSTSCAIDCKGNGCLGTTVLGGTSSVSIECDADMNIICPNSTSLDDIVLDDYTNDGMFTDFPSSMEVINDVHCNESNKSDALVINTAELYQDESDRIVNNTKKHRK